jgi:hypothetical protein
VDIRNRTVAQAVALLKRNKVTVGLFHYEARPGWFGTTPDPRKIPGGWYATDADPYAPGQVMLWVQAKRPGHYQDGAYYRRLFRGCR